MRLGTMGVPLPVAATGTIEAPDLSTKPRHSFVDKSRVTWDNPCQIQYWRGFPLRRADMPKNEANGQDTCSSRQKVQGEGCVDEFSVCAKGNTSGWLTVSLCMQCANSALAIQPANQARTWGSGREPNQAGSTAANWRTNGKMPMSVAHG